jgi:hypothetical protein
MLLLTLPIIAFTLSSCDREPPAKRTDSPVASSTTGFPEPTSPPPPPSAAPSLAPVETQPPPESRDPQVVLAAWRKAMETHDYLAARGIWGNHGEASGQPVQEFAAAWDKYRIIDITLGKGQQEGAAGSLYYEVPVTVTGLRRDGKPYHLAGNVILRRVNDVEGATPEQLRWHIESSTLKP